MMNLVDTFSEFKSGKNIDRPTMVRVLEDVFRTLIKKKYGTDDNFDVKDWVNNALQAQKDTNITVEVSIVLF